MTIPVPVIEPTEIVAGDFVTWTRTFSDYPAGTWVLTYTFINSTSKFSVTATASGTDHLVSILAATTAAYTAGVYRWQAYATSGVQRITVGSGETTVKANFATQTTIETRSQAKQTYDAIEAEILARASGGMTQEYTIGNRSLKKCPMSDLIVLRDKYRALVLSEQNAERIAAGLGGKNRLLVRI